MKARIVVFGGNGFLGQYLIKELIDRNYNVTCVDIKEIRNFRGHEYIHCDITDREKVRAVIQNGVFSVVYNLAGFANLDKAVHFPYETIRLNVLGNLNVLDGCKNSQIKRFVFASSAYAMSNKGSFYGISKLASEKLIEEYHKRYQLPFTVLRYGSIYSELPFENNYIYSLVEKAVKDKVIEHIGHGQEVREYIHASDAAKLSVDVIESNYYINMHVFLTGSERMKRIELFEMIREMISDEIKISLNTESEIFHYQYTPYSFDSRVCQKLIANPQIELGQGILECIREVYRKKREIDSQ